MMLIKTYLADSAIHGIGVHAGEDIRKGQVIGRFAEGFDRFYAADEILAMPQEMRDFLAHYSYGSGEGVIFPADNDRFTNHSSSPNTRTLPGGTVVALRDIGRGEELTCDYADFDDTWYRLFPDEEAVALVA